MRGRIAQIRIPVQLNRWAWAFLVLNVADCLLTAFIIGRGGVEANPVVQGDYGLWYKMAIAVVVVVLVGRNRWMMKALVVGMTLIVAWGVGMAAWDVVVRGAV